MDIFSPVFDNDIIIVGQQSWDTDIGSNCKNIALELSKTNRILYINSPLNRSTLFRYRNDPKVQKRLRVVRGGDDGLIEIQKNIWTYYPDCLTESINWISITRIFSFFNRYNNKIFAKSINKAISRLNFNNFVLFNDNEMFQGLYLKDYLKPVLSVYYVRDFMTAVEYWRKHGQVLEPLLIKKSDVCFANSEYLAAYCKEYNDHSYNVGQGCDIELFRSIEDKTVDRLADYKVPIIGYVGALNSARLDINIIEHIARSFPDHKIVLVGPEDSDFESSRLHQLKNVEFFGQVPLTDLPYYINAFDVCINPQLLNPVTIGNYPRKVDEYLALGKPVVATLTITMKFFSDYVYLAETKEEFVELISKAILEDGTDKKLARQNYAFTHTWEKSVSEMRSRISPLLEVRK